METEVTTAAHLPSSFRRLIALFIDGIISALPAGIGFLTGLISFADGEIFISWTAQILNLIVLWAYTFWVIKKYSATVGKLVLGLYFADAQTMRRGLTNKQVILRILGGLPTIVFSMAPVAIALFRTDRRQFADLVAGTQVLQKNPRSSPARRRWIIGTILFFVFCLSGLSQANNFFRNLRIDLTGIALRVVPIDKVGHF